MLQREREVGNVFRLFRNPDEEYDNYAAPTAIKVIDHDKQRWAMLTLGDVLARTGVWSGTRNDVTSNDGKYTEHLADMGNIHHPLMDGRKAMQVFGDLKTDFLLDKEGYQRLYENGEPMLKKQLTESTLRAAVRSLERAIVNQNLDFTDRANIKKALRGLCTNNVWEESDLDNIFYGTNRQPNAYERNIMFQNIGTSAATASVEEVADALQTAMLEAVVADEPTPEITAKVNSETIKTAVQDAVSITSDMSDAQRGSIASALVGAASGFKSSKSALRKVIRNKDEGKQRDADAAFGEALKKDMASNWKNINSEAKKIAANIGPTVDGEKSRASEKILNSQFMNRIMAIENMGFSDMQRVIARWYLGCSIDLPTIVSLDQQGIVTPFGAYVSCIYFPI